MKKIILVTGGHGLVGKAIQSISNEFKDYEFVFSSRSECDFTKMEETIQYFQKVSPQFVIHLAADVGGLYKNMQKKVELLENNVLMNINILKASHLVKVEKLIACLSTCIFPAETTYPIDESMLHLGPPHESNDAYAYAKRLLEVQCKAYQTQYGDCFVCVIPTNIYGPHDNYHLEDGHVIPSLIHKCYLSKMQEKDFVVSGTGAPLRQFIYSKDLARLMLWVLEHYHERDNLILSGNLEVSISHVAQLIAKCFEYDHRIVYDSSKSDGQYKKTADNSKLMNQMIHFSFTPIEWGIQTTVEWFIENFDRCRK